MTIPPWFQNLRRIIAPVINIKDILICWEPRTSKSPRVRIEQGLFQAPPPVFRSSGKEHNGGLWKSLPSPLLPSPIPLTPLPTSTGRSTPLWAYRHHLALGRPGRPPRGNSGSNSNLQRAQRPGQNAGLGYVKFKVGVIPSLETPSSQLPKALPPFLPGSGSSKSQLRGVLSFLRGTKGWVVGQASSFGHTTLKPAFPGLRQLLARRNVHLVGYGECVCHPLESRLLFRT